MALGGALGAGLLAWQGVEVALLANAASFALGGLLVLTARGLPRYEADEDEPEEHWQTRFAAGLASIRGHRPLLVLVVAQSAAMVFFALTEPIEVQYTRESLDAGRGGYGALIAAWGVGIMLGSALYTWLGTKRLAATALVATTAQGAAFIGLGAAP